MDSLNIVALFACLALAACLPNTTYLPTGSAAAIGMKRGRLAIIKSGNIAERDRFEVALSCESQTSALARTATENFRSSERNQRVSGVLSALLPIFPPGPIIGLPWAIRAARQDQTARAALVDAVNRHNDAPRCVLASGPGSVLGAGR